MLANTESKDILVNGLMARFANNFAGHDLNTFLKRLLCGKKRTLVGFAPDISSSIQMRLGLFACSYCI